MFLLVMMSQGRPLDFRFSNLGMKLFGHLDFADGDTDGAVHWKSKGPKLRRALQNEGAQMA